MTDTKSEARFSLDDVIVIRTPNDCKMCERRVNTYVENVKDWQRQYDEILAKHERVLQMLEIATKALKRIAGPRKKDGSYFYSIPEIQKMGDDGADTDNARYALEKIDKIESLK